MMMKGRWICIVVLIENDCFKIMEGNFRACQRTIPLNLTVLDSVHDSCSHKKYFSSIFTVTLVVGVQLPFVMVIGSIYPGVTNGGKQPPWQLTGVAKSKLRTKTHASSMHCKQRSVTAVMVSSVVTL